MTPDYAAVVERYQPVVGLETHVELGTVTKMFCGCANRFGDQPNTLTCPVCLGLPGSLPVINEAAVRYTVRIGLALHCDIAAWCRFARKNYFYPDMPKDYQISQYDEPLCTDGYLDVDLDGTTHRVGIERVHMEEDTGKALHVGGSTGRIHGATHSLVDYNRAGIPLVEIVTRPDISGPMSPELARAYVTTLRELLRSLGVSDVRMEQGSLRCDANVSLRRHHAEQLGTRTETKNVNSLRSVERAVRSEVLRQSGVLDAGERVRQETRHFDEASGTSRPGRSKEEATDYRYFPEPDLVPLALSADYVAAVRAELGETPDDRRDRLSQLLEASPLELEQMEGAQVLDLVVETVALGAPPADARAVWMNDVVAISSDGSAAPVTPAAVARVIELRAGGQLTARLGREALAGVAAGEGDVDAVVIARGLQTVSNDAELLAAVQAAIDGSPDVVAKVRSGKAAAVGALVGSVMKATKGKADAAKVRELLLSELTPPE